MTFFDELGLRAAEQLESAVGAYIAHASYKRLFDAPAYVRDRAVIGALRCALALGDDPETLAAAAALRSSSADAPSALPLAATTLLKGRHDLALAIASAELDRAGRPTAAYGAARAATAGGLDDANACELWSSVIDRATNAGDAVVGAQATAAFVRAWLERARRRGDVPIPRARLAEVAERASLTELAPLDRIPVLRARLLSASRFQRAAALSSLEEIARRQTGHERRLAIEAALVHFDAMPFLLDPIEIDRVRATLKHLDDEALRKRVTALFELALRALAAHVRPTSTVDAETALDQLAAASPWVAAARALDLSGYSSKSAPPEPTSAADHLVAIGLEAVGAIRAHAFPRAVGLFERAAELVSPDRPVPVVLWTAAKLAIGSSDARARPAALNLVSRALSVTLGLPPAPLAAFAVALLRAGADEPAALLLAEAARHRESGASALLADARRQIAYKSLSSGRRADARRLLVEARALFQRERPS
ncbi:MAG: hypothetical protein U0271_21880 [Polyangiaceae bacterium]